MYALAEEYGIRTYPTFTGGENIIQTLDGKLHRYSGLFPEIDPFALACLYLAMQARDAMAKEVPSNAPWTAHKAKEWDARSIGAWIDSPLHVASETAQAMLRLIMTEMFTSDPAEVSLLQVLFISSSVGGKLEYLIGQEGGTQQDLVVGTPQAIADAIAVELGDVLHLGAPVSGIAQDADRVVVTADTLAVEARRTIVAVPLTLAGQLRYDPPLPVDRALLQQRLPGGSAIRVVAVYEDAFWRAAGLSGETVGLGTHLPASIDSSPESGTPGVMNTYAFGPPAREIARWTADERRKHFLEALAERFGPRAASPIHYVEHDWAGDPWTRGCSAGHFPPGGLTSRAAHLRGDGQPAARKGPRRGHQGSVHHGRPRDPVVDSQEWRHPARSVPGGRRGRHLGRRGCRREGGR